MIQAYKRENNDFDKNGDMILCPTACLLSTVLNGEWVLELTHPVDNEGRWNSLEEEGVVACDTFVGDHQLFRIDDIEKADTEVKATAYPIFFDSADDCFLMDKRPENRTGEDALNFMMQGSRYSGLSDISKASTAYFTRRNLMDAINGEDSPTFIERWGGEILYHNYEIIINERVGGDYGTEVLYGKNLEGMTYKVDMSNVVTRIVPVAYNGRIIQGDAPWVDSENVGKYAKIYTKEVKFDDVKYIEDVDSDSEEEGVILCNTLDDLDKALQDKAKEQFTLGVDLPAITIDINMVDLSKTEEYAEFYDLERVSLGDTVHCRHSELGITTDARVIELAWDCIKQIPEDIKLGDYEQNYFSELSSTLNAVDKIIGKDNTVVAERIKGVINAINTQLRYQKSIAQKQDVRAILFEDIDPESPTYGAMCLGTQGFQIADTRTEDGRDWDWTTAFTAKGGYANTIVTGMISDKNYRSWWNLDTGEMVLSGDFIQRAENGNPSVMLMGNAVRFYDWEDTGDYSGSIGDVRQDATGRHGVEMWCDKGKVLSLGYAREKGSDLSLRSILQFDTEKESETPYVINTANGTLFPDNLGGGIVIENGLIKSWNMRYVTSGTIRIPNNFSWKENTSTGYMSAFKISEYLDVEVRDGMIMSWKVVKA